MKSLDIEDFEVRDHYSSLHVDKDGSEDNHSTIYNEYTYATRMTLGKYFLRTKKELAKMVDKKLMPL